MARLTPHLRLLPVAWVAGLLCVPAIAWTSARSQPNVEDAAKTASPPISVDTLRARRDLREDRRRSCWTRLPLRERALEALREDRGRRSSTRATNPVVALGHRRLAVLRAGAGDVYARSRVAAGRPDAGGRQSPRSWRGRLVASGRKTMVVLPGQKLLIHPRTRQRSDAGAEACARATRALRSSSGWASPGRSRPATGAESRSSDGGEPVFLKQRHALELARARDLRSRGARSSSRPGSRRPPGCARGPEIQHPGDLAKLMGITRRERRPSVLMAPHVRRPGRRSPASVLLIGDSQMEKSLLDPTGAPGAPPLRDASAAGRAVLHLGAGGCRGVRQADPERALDRRRDGDPRDRELRNAPLLAAPCARRRPDARRPRRLAPVRAARFVGVNGTLTIPASRAVSVTIHPSRRRHLAYPPPRATSLRASGAGDGGRNPRSAVTLSEEPLNGQPAPCATPVLSAKSDALFLPIPAGRSAADLVITIHGPPGTRLGRPETIQLDGRAVVSAPGPGR